MDLITGLSVALVTILILSAIRAVAKFVKRYQIISKLLPERPPETNFLTGNLKLFLQPEKLHLVLIDLAQRFPKIVTLDVGPPVLGFNTIICINKPDLVREIFTNHAQKLGPEPAVTHEMKIIIGNGLVTMEGEVWAKRHRLLSHKFLSPRAVVASFPVVENKAKILVEKMVGQLIKVQWMSIELT